MTASARTHFATAARRRGRRGFTFTEVLFAVMILGVGFILIAGIFPVSLSQVKLNNEESTAASVARAAVSYLQRQAELPNGGEMFRATVPNSYAPPSGGTLTFPQSFSYYGQVWSLYDDRMHLQTTAPADPFTHQAQRDLMWGTVSGNMIFSGDPRFAWTAVYRRDMTYLKGTNGSVSEVPDPYAQVTVIVLQSRNKPTFTQEDIATRNLAARRAKATFATGAQCEITTNPQYAAEGAYVIVSQDPGVSGRRPEGWMNGRVYRLGTREPTDPNKYDLVPGSDFQTDPGPDGKYGNADDVSTLNNVEVVIVGPGFLNGAPEGSAMDVSAFTSYVKVSN